MAGVKKFRARSVQDHDGGSTSSAEDDMEPDIWEQEDSPPVPGNPMGDPEQEENPDHLHGLFDNDLSAAEQDYVESARAAAVAG